MADVESQVVDQIGVRIVRHDNIGCTMVPANQARQSSSRAELEHRLALDQSVGMSFKVVCGDARGVPY